MDYEFLKVGTSTGVILSEWKGAISLECGYQDKEGKIQLEWVRGQHYDKEAKKKVPDDKDRPLKIYLGSKERAIEVLEAIIRQLDPDFFAKDFPERQEGATDDQDLPF